jgi:signal recognition particle subunit SRP54
MASRILGMGDIVSLVEKAQANFDAEQAQELERKLREQTFDMEDFLQQLQQMRKMGSLEDLLGLVPGLGGKMKELRGQIDEKDMDRLAAIIQSMTRAERRNPSIISGGRKKRVALGSGTKVQDVNRLLKQFEEAKRMMKQFSGPDMKRGARGWLRSLGLPQETSGKPDKRDKDKKDRKKRKGR